MAASTMPYSVTELCAMAVVDNILKTAVATNVSFFIRSPKNSNLK
jgi:hypothetical protein